MQQITSASIAAKFKSKYEIHCKCQAPSLTFLLLVFLTVDCGFYIPQLDQVTIYWCKDLINGTKKALGGLEIVHLACPQFETLTTEKIIAFGHAHSDRLVQYMPDPKDVPKLP